MRRFPLADELSEESILSQLELGGIISRLLVALSPMATPPSMLVSSGVHLT